MWRKMLKEETINTSGPVGEVRVKIQLLRFEQTVGHFHSSPLLHHHHHRVPVKTQKLIRTEHFVSHI